MSGVLRCGHSSWPLIRLSRKKLDVYISEIWGGTFPRWTLAGSIASGYRYGNVHHRLQVRDSGDHRSAKRVKG
jgi:hypothetical protein